MFLLTIYLDTYHNTTNVHRSALQLENGTWQKDLEIQTMLLCPIEMFCIYEKKKQNKRKAYFRRLLIAVHHQKPLTAKIGSTTKKAVDSPLWVIKSFSLRYITLVQLGKVVYCFVFTVLMVRYYTKVKSGKGVYCFLSIVHYIVCTMVLNDAILK